MNRPISICIGLLLGAAMAASACKVNNPGHSIIRKVQGHSGTYHGTVVRNEIGRACGTEMRLLTLKVQGAFGSLAEKGDTVTVVSSRGDCGVSYAVGAEVVIFANSMRNCIGPDPKQTTSEMDFNEVNPTRALLDSLYQLPTALARPGENAVQAAGPVKGRRAAGVLFAAPGTSDAGIRRGDGRRVDR